MTQPLNIKVGDRVETKDGKIFVIDRTDYLSHWIFRGKTFHKGTRMIASWDKYGYYASNSQPGDWDILRVLPNNITVDKRTAWTTSFIFDTDTGVIKIKNKPEEKTMFDLKVGDKVKFNNGWIGEVVEIDNTMLPYNIECEKFLEDVWFAKDGTTCGIGQVYSKCKGIHIIQKLDTKKPLEFVVGRFYKNREGNKVKLIADWRNEEGIEEAEVLQWIDTENNEQYGTCADGRYTGADGRYTGLPLIVNDEDIIGYWEEPKPNSEKKDARDESLFKVHCAKCNQLLFSSNRLDMANINCDRPECRE